MKSDVEHPKLGKVVDMVKNILEKIRMRELLSLLNIGTL